MLYQVTCDYCGATYENGVKRVRYCNRVCYNLAKRGVKAGVFIGSGVPVRYRVNTKNSIDSADVAVKKSEIYGLSNGLLIGDEFYDMSPATLLKVKHSDFFNYKFSNHVN